MANDRIPWKTPAIYPMGRTAEFVLAALPLLQSEDDAEPAELLEYVVETEHSEGDSYWNSFPTLSDALDDFLCFLEHSTGE